VILRGGGGLQVGQTLLQVVTMALRGLLLWGFLPLWSDLVPEFIPSTSRFGVHWGK
jgi:hypothetical protein